jgi:hypothetical protein
MSNNTNPEQSNYDDAIAVSDLYIKAQRDVEFQEEKGWETIKFFLTFSSTLFTVTLGLFFAIQYFKLGSAMTSGLSLSLILIMIILVIFSKISEVNFARECKRMYENIAIIMKIEDEFGRRIKRAVLKEEAYYIPDTWKQTKQDTTRDFVRSVMTPKQKTRDLLLQYIKYYFSIIKKALKRKNLTEQKQPERDETFYIVMRPIFPWLRYAAYIIIVFIIIFAILD